ncbi:MAG: hypothetical protein ACLPXZ_08155 [Mycobacterium sp.]
MNASAYHDAVWRADRTHTLFGQVMGYVAATTALFALGAYLGRNLGYGWAFVFYILALGCIIGWASPFAAQLA